MFTQNHTQLYLESNTEANNNPRGEMPFGRVASTASSLSPTFAGLGYGNLSTLAATGTVAAQFNSMYCVLFSLIILLYNDFISVRYSSIFFASDGLRVMEGSTATGANPNNALSDLCSHVQTEMRILPFTTGTRFLALVRSRSIFCNNSERLFFPTDTPSGPHAGDESTSVYAPHTSTSPPSSVIFCFNRIAPV